MPLILFATRNPWKDKQFRPTFEAYGFKMQTLLDSPITNQNLEELGTNPVENALIKARTFHSAEHPWVFADDAGLEIDALNVSRCLNAMQTLTRYLCEIDGQGSTRFLRGNCRPGT